MKRCRVVTPCHPDSVGDGFIVVALWLNATFKGAAIRSSRPHVQGSRVSLWVFVFVFFLFPLSSVFALEGIEGVDRLEYRPPLFSDWSVSPQIRYSLLTGGADSVLQLNWDDLYENGIGGGIELSVRIYKGIRLWAEAGYDRYDGKSVVGSTGIGQLSPFSVWSFYLGTRFFPTDWLTFRIPRMRPYVSVAVGVSLFDGQRFNGRELESSGAVAFSVGGGMDLLLWKRWALFVEGRYQHSGRPKAMDEPLTTLPISLGLRIPIGKDSEAGAVER